MIKCNRCHNAVKKSELPQYHYQCMHCDEDLYGIETYEEKTEAPFKCPLCGEDIEYKEYKNTHIWSCPVCPFVSFEYYDDNDTAKVLEFLSDKREYDYEELGDLAKDTAYQIWLNDYMKDGFVFENITDDIEEFNKSDLPIKFTDWIICDSRSDFLEWDFKDSSIEYDMTPQEIWEYIETRYIKTEPKKYCVGGSVRKSKLLRVASGNYMEHIFHRFWKENYKIAIKDGISEFFYAFADKLLHDFQEDIQYHFSVENFEDYYSYELKYDKNGKPLED